MVGQKVAMWVAATVETKAVLMVAKKVTERVVT